MDNSEHGDVSTNREDLKSSSPLAKFKNVTNDTRSREAFELLKLGEAICSLQTDQRKMRLSVEDLRFERDRYKSSAASFQNKLNDALNENLRLRDLRNALHDLTVAEQGSSFYHSELARINGALLDRDRDIQEKSNIICDLENRLDELMHKLNHALIKIDVISAEKNQLNEYIDDLRKYSISFIKDFSE